MIKWSHLPFALTYFTNTPHTGLPFCLKLFPQSPETDVPFFLLSHYPPSAFLIKHFSSSHQLQVFTSYSFNNSLQTLGNNWVSAGLQKGEPWLCAVEVIKYGLEPTVFVDGLCIAIDLRADTPEKYIIYALFSPSQQWWLTNSKRVRWMSLWTGGKSGLPSVWVTPGAKGGGHKTLTDGFHLPAKRKLFR